MANAVKKTTGKQTWVGSGKAGPGRPKGVQNKTTQLAKDAIAAAAEGLGGTERLIAWAKSSEKNETVFWSQLYTKLLPLQLTGEGGGPIRFEDALNALR